MKRWFHSSISELGCLSSLPIIGALKGVRFPVPCQALHFAHWNFHSQESPQSHTLAFSRETAGAPPCSSARKCSLRNGLRAAGPTHCCLPAPPTAPGAELAVTHRMKEQMYE